MKNNKTNVKIRFFDVNAFISTSLAVSALCYIVKIQNDEIHRLNKELRESKEE